MHAALLLTAPSFWGSHSPFPPALLSALLHLLGGCFPPCLLSIICHHPPLATQALPLPQENSSAPTALAFYRLKRTPHLNVYPTSLTGAPDPYILLPTVPGRITSTSNSVCPKPLALSWQTGTCLRVPHSKNGTNGYQDAHADHTLVISDSSSFSPTPSGQPPSSAESITPDPPLVCHLSLCLPPLLWSLFGHLNFLPQVLPHFILSNPLIGCS